MSALLYRIHMSKYTSGQNFLFPNGYHHGLCLVAIVTLYPCFILVIDILACGYLYCGCGLCLQAEQNECNGSPRGPSLRLREHCDETGRGD